MSAVTDQEVEAYLETGLRNYWHPVVPSWRVGPTPLGLTRLSQNIVLWRDSHGTVHALEDRCPHRGARLSLGRNLGDRVACWYHGVEVDKSGVICRVPAVNDSLLEGRQCVRTYPCQEMSDAVFVYFGDALHPEPPRLELPEQLASPAWAAMLCSVAWACDYRYVIDNVVDPMHGAYLHAQSHSMADGDKRAEMQLSKTQAGFIFEKVGQRDVNFDWVELGESGAIWMRLAIPYQKMYGPGGPFYIVAMVTPIDRENAQVFLWRCRAAQGWKRDVWKFLYKNRLEGLHWEVLQQDQLLLENMAPEARNNEHLYQHDGGVLRTRRLMKARAREHLEALAMNATPRAVTG
jgi:phenylpropionate dioxygenase-like ring-hydroxylating dioxygenase large terminal subunit